jgi:hypothetical protein
MRISLQFAMGLPDAVPSQILAHFFALIRTFYEIPAGNHVCMRSTSPPFGEEVGHGRRDCTVHRLPPAKPCQHGMSATTPGQVGTQSSGRTTAGRPTSSPTSARCGTIRLPWRALGLGLSAIGGTAAAYYSHPLVGQAIVICETAAAMITVATALFGSETTSERAFRLLRWLTNRPEPDAPPTQIAQVARRSSRAH